MKFVDFGDLVEVTYDDESVELISKEEATKLGYKEIQEIKIPYEGKIYTSTEFSRRTDINDNFIGKCYRAGICTGEAIITEYAKRGRKQKYVKIPYNNQILSVAQFSEHSGIKPTTIHHYLAKGFSTGEEIIIAYNKVQTSKPTITYKNKNYDLLSFSKLPEVKISYATIRTYYKDGLRTGEEMIEKHNNCKLLHPIVITYANKSITLKQFSELVNVPFPTAKYYCDKGIKTGEEILTLYNKNKVTLVSYQGGLYTFNKLSKLINISSTTISNYYADGIYTGEKMIEHYNRRKAYSTRSNVRKEKLVIPYNGCNYTTEQLSSITGISKSTITSYYRKGYKTGEEMIAYYNRNK